MTRVLLFATVALASVAARAELKSCDFEDKLVQVHFEKSGDNVSGYVREANLRNAEKVGDPAQPQYVAKTQEGLSFEIQNVSLEKIIESKKIGMDVVQSALFRMSAFDGEEDMVWSYASSYVTKLKCQ